MNAIVNNIVMFLNGLPTEVVWALTLLVCFFSIIIFYRLFGKSGLYVYIALSVIIANIQVLKSTLFFFSPKPVALGTIVFATSYLCSDILAEYHSKKDAQKAVAIGFVSYILWTVIMILTLGFMPLTAKTAGSDMMWNIPFSDAMKLLFSPAPIFFIAGMGSYLVSQFNDIWLFHKIRYKTGKRHLWLRNTVSTSVSALLDNTVFSILAWVVLTERPLPWDVVIFTYILGTYGMRVCIAFLDTPFVYLAGFCNRKER